MCQSDAWPNAVDKAGLLVQTTAATGGVDDFDFSLRVLLVMD